MNKELTSILGGSNPLAGLPAELLPKGSELLRKTLGALPRYRAAKISTKNFVDYLRTKDFDSPENKAFSLDSRVARLDFCGEVLEFKSFHEVNKIRVHSHYCQEHLACAVCAIRRSGRLLRAYAPKIFSYMKKNPDLRPYLITFTVKNAEDLKPLFNLLRRSFRSFMRKGYEHNRGQKKTFCEASRIKAGIASYEIKRGKGSNLWHPHIHLLAFSSSDFDFVRLRDEWSAEVGQLSNVNVQKVDYSPDVLTVDLENATDIDILFNNARLGGAILEVLKYPLKFGDLPFDDRFYVWRFFKGARLVQTYGSDFKSVVVPENENDEDQDLKDAPFIRFMFFYEDSIKNYEYDSTSLKITDY